MCEYFCKFELCELKLWCFVAQYWVFAHVLFCNHFCCRLKFGESLNRVFKDDAIPSPLLVSYFQYASISISNLRSMDLFRTYVHSIDLRNIKKTEDPSTQLEFSPHRHASILNSSKDQAIYSITLNSTALMVYINRREQGVIVYPLELWAGRK